MKKALILLDGRIAEVTDAEFPVHPDLKWVDVADDTTARDRYANGVVFKEVVPVPPAKKSLSAESLTELLIEKGRLTKADVDAKIVAEKAADDALEVKP